MKKREFIKAGLLTTGASLSSAASASNAGRLYGTPGSVIPIIPAKADKIKLSLSRMDIPPAAWDTMVNYFNAAEQIGAVPEQRDQFLANPSLYLSARGLSPDVVQPDSLDISLLRVSSDSLARSSAQVGDYTMFLHRLKELQVMAPAGPSDLSKTLTSMLRENVNAYTAVKSAFASNTRLEEHEPDFVTASFESAEVLLAQSDDSDGDGYVSDAYLNTSISVYTNVMAVTNVAAVTQAGVVVAAYLLVAVAVSAVAVVLAAGANAPGAGRLARLDPRLMESAGRASAAARLLGNKSFELKIVKDLLRQEIVSIYEAAEAVGIIKMKARYKEMAIAAALEHAHKALGLNADSYGDYRRRVRPKSPRSVA